MEELPKNHNEKADDLEGQTIIEKVHRGSSLEHETLLGKDKSGELFKDLMRKSIETDPASSQEKNPTRNNHIELKIDHDYPSETLERRESLGGEAKGEAYFDKRHEIKNTQDNKNDEGSFFGVNSLASIGSILASKINDQDTNKEQTPSLANHKKRKQSPQKDKLGYWRSMKLGFIGGVAVIVVVGIVLIIK